MPSLGGVELFGGAVKMQVLPNPTAQQISEFFGVDGTFQMHGGSRGFVVMVEGILAGADIATLNANEAIWYSFMDGVGRQLIDTRGRAWDNVVFRGQFQVDPIGPKPLVGFVNGDGSNWWALPYKAILHGLL